MHKQASLITAAQLGSDSIEAIASQVMATSSSREQRHSTMTSSAGPTPLPETDAAVAKVAAAWQQPVTSESERASLSHLRALRDNGGAVEDMEGDGSDMALLDAWWQGQRGKQSAYWQEIAGRMDKYNVARARVEEEILRRWAAGGVVPWWQGSLCAMSPGDGLPGL
jgi:hypothetical protein